MKQDTNTQEQVPEMLGVAKFQVNFRCKQELVDTTFALLGYPMMSVVKLSISPTTMSIILGAFGRFENPDARYRSWIICYILIV